MFDAGAAGETAEAIPEPPVEPRTRPGDLWLLGDHRLLCGDATKSADVKRLMNGQRATLMATDPPYLVDYDGGNHPQTWGKDGRKISSEDKTRHWDFYVDPDLALSFYVNYLEVALAEALAERAPVYQWFGVMRAPLVFAAWQQVGLLTHQVIIWAKSRSVLTRCDYQWNYEGCLYGWRAGKRPPARRRPPASAAALWQIDSVIEDGQSGLHPTMKPLECMRRPISYHTLPGEICYEPFAGSGTTLIAAELERRRCYCLEISAAFCDVIVARYERLTGTEAVRDD